MNVETRNAIASDLVFAYEVKKQAIGPYIERTTGWDEEYQRDTHTKSFNPDVSEIILYDDVEVGWIVVTKNKNVMELKELYITNAWQDRGIGSELLRRLCKDAQFEKLPIRLSFHRINPVRKFYERHGFRVIKEDSDLYTMEFAV